MPLTVVTFSAKLVLSHLVGEPVGQPDIFYHLLRTLKDLADAWTLLGQSTAVYGGTTTAVLLMPGNLAFNDILMTQPMPSPFLGSAMHNGTNADAQQKICQGW